MKVIVTGATGLVGTSVLRECIANKEITEIFVLTRKPIDDDLAANKKMTVIRHDDFLTYPLDLMGRLQGADACIWALGGRRSQFSDMESFRKISVDYLLAAARALVTYVAPSLPSGQPFRFIFTSGKDAEWDQDKSLIFMEETRHVKGQCEKGLAELQDGSGNEFQVWFMRPSVILPAGSGCMTKGSGKLYGGVPVEDLAEGMVKTALHGYPERVIEMGMLKLIE